MKLKDLSNEFPKELYQGDYIKEIADSLKFEDMPYEVQCRIVAKFKFIKKHGITANQFVNGCRSGIIKFAGSDGTARRETMFGSDKELVV